MHKNSQAVLLALAALLLAGRALAGSGANHLLDVREAPIKQVARIHQDLTDGTSYAEIGMEQKSQVQAALLRISSAFERYPDLGKMPAAEKVAVFNDQEAINTILTKAGEDSRVICRRETSIGSHMSSNNCMTVAERKRISDRHKRDLADAQRTGRALEGGQ